MGPGEREVRRDHLAAVRDPHLHGRRAPADEEDDRLVHDVRARCVVEHAGNVIDSGELERVERDAARGPAEDAARVRAAVVRARDPLDTGVRGHVACIRGPHVGGRPSQCDQGPLVRGPAGPVLDVREPADIEDLIGSAIGQVEDRLVERDIQITIPPDLPMVSLDFVLIVHALGNLLDNASKYSPEGSLIEIEARQLGQEIQISILDRGVGIPPDDLTHIFDKFYRVRHPEQVTGTGLGLAISKGIVEAHGGRIWAANRPGGGTVFTIALFLGTNEDP